MPTSTEKDSLIGEIEDFIHTLVVDMSPGPPAAIGPGRPTILPALALWSGLPLCVLRGFNAQLDLWRLLRDHRLWEFPRFLISDQAVYKRLAQAGTAVTEDFLTTVTAALKERLQPAMDTTLAPFATEVVVIDCSTPDKVRRLLPALWSVPNSVPNQELLPGKLQSMFDVRRQLWHTVKFTPNPHQNEKPDARELVATLPKGSLGGPGLFRLRLV